MFVKSPMRMWSGDIAFGLLLSYQHQLPTWRKSLQTGTAVPWAFLQRPSATGYNVDDTWLKLKTKEVEGFIDHINTVDHSTQTHTETSVFDSH